MSDGVCQRYLGKAEESSKIELIFLSEPQAPFFINSHFPGATDPALPLLLPSPPIFPLLLPINKRLVSPSQLLPFPSKQKPSLTQQELLARDKRLPHQVLPLQDEELLPLPPHPLTLPLLLTSSHCSQSSKPHN